MFYAEGELKMGKSEKHSGTTPAGVLGTVTTGDQRSVIVDPLKFYSPRDPWTTAQCGDGGLIICTKGDIICHSDRNHGRDDLADIALFPMIAISPEMFATLQKIASFHTWNESATASPQIRLTKADLSNVLDVAILSARSTIGLMAPVTPYDKPRNDGTAIEPGHEPGAA